MASRAGQKQKYNGKELKKKKKNEKSAGGGNRWAKMEAVGIGRSATYNTHGLKLWNKFTMQGRS